MEDQHLPVAKMKPIRTQTDGDAMENRQTEAETDRQMCINRGWGGREEDGKKERRKERTREKRRGGSDSLGADLLGTCLPSTSSQSSTHPAD